MRSGANGLANLLIANSLTLLDASELRCFSLMLLFKFEFDVNLSPKNLADSQANKKTYIPEGWKSLTQLRQIFMHCVF